MKKWFILCVLLVLSSIILWKVEAKSRNSTSIAFTDVTSLNFKEKTAQYNIENILKICTYDFCDYVRGESKIESMEIFMRNYLKNIDREIAATLRVKGIRITNIILK